MPKINEKNDRKDIKNCTKDVVRERKIFKIDKISVGRFPSVVSPTSFV